MEWVVYNIYDIVYSERKKIEIRDTWRHHIGVQKQKTPRSVIIDDRIYNKIDDNFYAAFV